MPTKRVLITVFCVVLVVLQCGYLVLVRQDGTLDEDKLPEWSRSIVEPINESLVDESAASLAEASRGPGGVVTGDNTGNDATVDMTDVATMAGDQAVTAGAEGGSISQAEMESATTEPSSDASDSSESGESAGPAADDSAIDSTVGQVLAPVRRAVFASVRVTDDATGIVGCGSVVAIDAGGFDVLTAAHVLRGMVSAQVEFLDPGSVADPYSSSGEPAGVIRRCRQVRSVAVDDTLDLALLRVTSAFRPEFSLSLPNTNRAERIAASVRSRGGVDAFRAGWMSADRPETSAVRIVGTKRAKRRRSDVPVNYFAVDVPTIKGDSGAGLFDGDGVLLGVASGNSLGRGYFCDASEILRFLAEFSGDDASANTGN
ncbi:S1 family peptidase [Crateriforma spongiae]|uniref:S1 family peptidase n=1 Tax=Crateriforma spongiae TaxID=2724528 RepID=UPI0014460E46|nr:serine protease [Crateriforma spongiae]